MPTTAVPRTTGKRLMRRFSISSHDLVERSVLGDGQRAECHDLVDLAPMGAGVFIRKPAGSHQVFQPARSPALGPGFGAPEKIAFRYDADELTAFFDHGQTADVPLQHDADGLQDGAVRRDRYHGGGHDVSDFHGDAPFSLRSP